MKNPKAGTTPAATQPPPAPEAAAAPDAPPAPAARDRAFVEEMTTGIRQVVDGHRDAIIDCYRRAARVAIPGTTLRGQLEIHLKILPAGDAEDVRVVKNETGSAELGDCLVLVMQGWRYPSPGAEPMEFVWPYTFRGQR